MEKSPKELGHQHSSFYVDSPMPGSIKQFEPFFASGFFDAEKTEIITRRRVGGPDFSKAPHLKNVIIRKENTLPHLAFEDKVAVFYSFNSKSNVSITANRRVKHALILHGESNKISSCRPIARLYDHVCVSGYAAITRYLDAGIFRMGDVDGGRLIRTGDTFIQTIPYIRASTPADNDPWVLYAPTWENSSAPENYSSAVDGYGFTVAQRAAEVLGIRRIAIKLHPNFGKHDKSLLTTLRRMARGFVDNGFEVKFLEDNLDFLTKLRLKLSIGQEPFFHDRSKAMAVKLAIVDVSGMEAICLKQNIPHLVILKPEANNAIPEYIKENVYNSKAINFRSSPGEIEGILSALFDGDFQTRLDNLHRNAIFSYSCDELKAEDYAVRHSALLKFMNENTYWK
ncbi:hypothetical protein [Mesorhizobium sp. SP-1A]|uniref:hypothetical protein n=1 Tax=Mesorhizobium sp. SP-1A TaxID=3077840 RepID=UPI0028F70D63|nr:hypothetical protein [Mesorhizobium sp. SP-1A]